jgi:hypothetical protein
MCQSCQIKRALSKRNALLFMTWPAAMCHPALCSFSRESCHCHPLPVPDPKSFSTAEFIFFRCLESFEKAADGDLSDGFLNDPVTKFVHACNQAIISSNIRRAFHRAGLFPKTQARPYKLVCDGDTLSIYPSFAKIWNFVFFVQSSPRDEALVDSKLSIPNSWPPEQINQSKSNNIFIPERIILI